MIKQIWLLSFPWLFLSAPTAFSQPVFVPGQFQDLSRDTIVLQQKPEWKTDFPIFNYCGYFRDHQEKPMSFDIIKKQTFIPYFDSLKHERPNHEAFIVEWLKFSIRNESSDTLALRLAVGARYFVELYDNQALIAKSGIYETSVAGPEKSSVPLLLLPKSSTTYWLKSTERLNYLTDRWIALQTPLAFMAARFEDVRRDRVLFLSLSLVTGCLFFITFFAAWQFYLYKDNMFLWYIAYTLCGGFTGLFWVDIRQGFGIFSSFWHDVIFSVFLFVVPVLYSQFIGMMLKLPENFPKTWIAIRIFMAVALIQAVIEFSTMQTGHFIFMKYFSYFNSMIPVAALNLFLLVLSALSTERVKWFMFFGILSMLILWSSPLLVPLTLEFSTDPVKVLLFFIPFYFLCGMAIEAICFAFALSYRSRLIQIERDGLQQHYHLQLKEELLKKTVELHAQSQLVETQKIEQLETAYQKRLAETEMAALRAQMNPHFIFNCLNSIKLYTLEADSQAASDYLTKFAQLIRLVLENSRSERVTLEKELETLRLYIDLEVMRFKNKVSYVIEVAPDIDQEIVELPPLLIQPYVENAIWHGLINKKNGGTIAVRITQPDDSHLQIEISDDGVGREKAALLQSKSATREKSFGLQVTSERIEVIKVVYGILADVEVADLKDTFDNAIGTKVIVRIPL